MIPCLYQTPLDSLIDEVLERLRDQQRRRGRTFSTKAVRARVRREVREAVAQEALTPGSCLMEWLVKMTDYVLITIPLPDVGYFSGLCGGHPDLVGRWPVEVEPGKLLAAYCLAAEGSILADLREY